MRRVLDFSDKRQKQFCAYCAAETETHDHVPSRVLLDSPYPDDLPWVWTCADCNNSLSMDEEYLACLVECVICGSVRPPDIRREKVRDILSKKTKLAARLDRARVSDSGRTIFTIEADRVSSVILKLARGHALYELGEPQLKDPSILAFAPLEVLSPEARRNFENPPEATAWPEVGSRSMFRLIEEDSVIDWPGWVVVQPARYRYSATVSDGIVVRMVLSEYLGAEVTWA